MADPTDPVVHAARFLWVFAILPAIFTGIGLATASMTGGTRPEHLLGLVWAAVIAGIGFGVHRRSQLAAKIGIGLFAVACLAGIAAGILRGKPAAGLFITVLCVWPVLKLKAALEAMRGDRPA